MNLTVVVSVHAWRELSRVWVLTGRSKAEQYIEAFESALEHLAAGGEFVVDIPEGVNRKVATCWIDWDLNTRLRLAAVECDMSQRAFASAAIERYVLLKKSNMQDLPAAG